MTSTTEATANETIKDCIRFVQFDAASAKALDDYREDLLALLPKALDVFYDHLQQWPQLAGMFDSPQRMEHAKQGQFEHWKRLFAARFDDAYVASVRRIGTIHSKVGLEPRWYIMGYAFTLNHLYRDIAHRFSSRMNPKAAQEKTAALLRAVNQCTMIDMDMAISVYLDANKQAYDEKIATLSEKFEASLGSVVKGVSATADQLNASAETLAGMAETTSGSATNVAASSEETSVNVSTVSAATEEMSASIAHVAELAANSFAASEHVLKEAGQSVAQMEQLKQTVDVVGSMLDLVKGIAKQTDMLALNATIESARAGEAGKGFAVVAAAVKTLASETSKVTENIKQKIEEMLNNSAAAVSSIHAMRDRVSEMNALSKDTATSADQQRLAMLEIARNVEQVAVGASEISTNTQEISHAASATGDAAGQLLKAVKELAAQQELLNRSAHAFISAIRA